MDREKVIKALECRKNADKRCGNPCEESGMCHYATAVRDINGEIYRPFICDRERICVDALALLKKQEESEARLLTAEEVRNMKAGTAFGIETYYDHDGKRMPGCTWALRTESLIISFFGTMFPDTVSKIPYNTLEKNENTGKHEKHQYRFWSRKPTFEQCKEVKWE